MGEAAEKMKLLIAILFVCRLFTFQASRTDTVHVWKTYLPGRDWEIKMSPVLSSSLNCQIPSNELRAHRRHPAPPHPACFSASLSPPHHSRPHLRSSLPILSQAARRVCPGALEWKEAMWVLVAYFGVNTGDSFAQCTPPPTSRHTHVSLFCVGFCSPDTDVIYALKGSIFGGCFVMATCTATTLSNIHIHQTHGQTHALKQTVLDDDGKQTGILSQMLFEFFLLLIWLCLVVISFSKLCSILAEMCFVIG